MKSNTLLTATVLLGAALATSACDEGLADINENPNAPKDVPAQVILPQAIQGTVEEIYGNWFNLEFTGLFAQHWAKIQYVEEDQYDLRPASISNWWEDLYARDLKDWQLIIDKGQEPRSACGSGGTPAPCANHEATGRVMKSYTAQIMTDIWGDIPYTEALQGDAEDPIIRPVYDSQESVYQALVADLETALGLFDPGATSWGSEDLIYGGDIGLWMKFANSLKLRMAMRISDVAPAQAQTWAEEAASHPAGLITDNSESASLVFLSGSPNQNPLFENAKSRDDHAVSETLVEILTTLNDPRLAVYAEPAASDGEFRGMPNGVPENEVPVLNTISRIGDLWRNTDDANSATTPAWLLHAAEVHFLLAEAALNGWAVGGTAQGHYEAGVRAAMAMYDGADGVTLDQATVDAYLAQPGVAWGTGDSNLELIIEQKWLSLYTSGWEAYAEFRRTGYPDEITIRAGHLLDHVPGRIPYPLTEQALNNANWKAALDAQGIDGTYTGKVWWEPTLDDNAPVVEM